MKISKSTLIRALLLAFSSPTIADTDTGNLFELSLQELLDVKIVTATRTLEQRSKSASSTLVINAADIRQLGARNIHDVLQLLPGYRASQDGFGANQITFRGVRTLRSEKLIYMLNGHILNDVRFGSASYQFLDKLPVDNIKQIEVVYGPGSALYGANAFLGVINIITQSGEDFQGSRLSLKDEFEDRGNITTQGNYQYGHRADNHAIQLNLHAEKNNGATLYTPADALGRPGNADTQEQLIDLQLQWQFGDFSLQGHHFQRDAGDYFGGLDVINHQSSQQVSQSFLDGRYQLHLNQDWQGEFRLYADYGDTDNDYVGLPAGSIPVGHPLYAWNSTGYLARLLAKESVYGAELNLVQQHSDHQHWNGGIGWRRERLFNPRTISNFNPTPLPVPQDVSATYNWIDSGTRSITSAYLQDRIDVLEDLRLTLGGRYDHYSDFGSTFNPRVGLAWQVDEQLTLRASHGRAFRAPDFYSQLVQNNPVRLGNPDLGPEEIHTSELAAEWRHGNNWWVHAAWYHSKLDELIDVPPSSMQFQNLEQLSVNGLELKLDYWPVEKWRLGTSYAYTDSRFDNGDAMADVPRHSGSLSSLYKFGRSVDWNINMVWTGDSPRAVDDSRPDMDGYTVVNSTVNYTLDKQWQVSGSVYNLFDHDYQWPSPASTVPGDYPAPGRSFMFGLMITP